MVNIGLIQMAAKPLKVGANLSKAEHYISQTVKNGAEIIVLPEMFNVGFSTNEKLFNFGETLDGDTVTWLKNQAEKHEVYIITSIYEKFEGFFYNTMVMVGSDRSLQIYRKRNPTCQERIVWKRYEAPGPGIFDTPFGRIGGAICFDSFARETFEGFKQSRVDIVIIVALWGTILPMWKYPDSLYFNKLLKYQSHLASEAVPQKYAEDLGVPAVYVNQSGTVKLPITHPTFYPSPKWQDSKYVFIGNSNVHDKTGQKLVNNKDSNQEFCIVVPLEINQKKDLPQISKVDVPLNYMSNKYYFVKPPVMFRFYQKLCFAGFEKQYNKMCYKYAHSSKG